MLFRVHLQEEKLNQMKIKVDQQEEELRTSTENPAYGMLKYTANYCIYHITTIYTSFTVESIIRYC
jgi:hypothetical protein